MPHAGVSCAETIAWLRLVQFTELDYCTGTYWYDYVPRYEKVFFAVHKQEVRVLVAKIILWLHRRLMVRFTSSGLLCSAYYDANAVDAVFLWVICGIVTRHTYVPYMHAEQGSAWLRYNTNIGG